MKLRIGQIGPLSVSIPPKKYGGTERIIDLICRELTKRGHDVFLFAAKGAKTKAHIIPITQKPLWANEIKETTPYYAYEMSVIAKESRRLKLDILHDHLGPWSLSLYNSVDNIPIIHTLHVPTNFHRQWAYKKLKAKLVSISNNQRSVARNLNYIKTIYNGIDTGFFKYNPRPEKYLLFVGELVERKGVLDAIIIAKKIGVRLLIAGRIPLSIPSQINDFNFFREHIKPLLNRGNIRYLGELSGVDIVKLYAKAYLTLFPIHWQEPFGLVMVESMSCGTPVIAFDRGSVPEVIRDGQTGFLINSSDSNVLKNWIIKESGIKGMIEAVKRVYNMSEKEYREMRYNCRKHVEENFTVKKMVDEYEKVYEKILSKSANWRTVGRGR